MPIRAIITAGTVADCTKAIELIDGIEAKNLIADRGYDSNNIVNTANSQGMNVVIPPRKNRKIKRKYDKEMYRTRHLVENCFMHLKQWRGIATRYAKNTKSFIAAITIRCMFLWAKTL